MGRVVDTSVLIDLERQPEAFEDRLEELRSRGDSFLTPVLVGELGVGIELADSAERRGLRESSLERVLTFLPVLPFDTTSAYVWSQLYAELHRIGTRVGERDLIIAAIAQAHGHSVLTANVREFERVPGLTVERWA